jgi:hypothetical protein
MISEKGSKLSYSPYIRRFGTWTETLIQFVNFINFEINSKDIDETIGNKHITTRDINIRLRFKVMQRDNFKCCACGSSPANDPSIILHVDHVIPWSKGGETLLDNLQTLCSKCNLGKSNLE